MWYGLRKVMLTVVAVLSVCAMPAFMNQADAKGGGGKGGGKGGPKHTHNHNHKHHHHHHKHHHRHGRYWYNGRWYLEADGGAVAIYQVFIRQTPAVPWEAVASFYDLDEAEEKADSYRDLGYEAVVE
jgi:ABC-type Zn2+ transport system substrate-binding protein/surface adhesin